MEQYSLQPGPLEIIKGGKQTDVLDSLHDLLKMMPHSYTLLRPLGVEVLQGKGTVTMRYSPSNREMGTIEVVGGSVNVAELLMRSEIAEAWRKYLVISNSSPILTAKFRQLVKN